MVHSYTLSFSSITSAHDKNNSTLEFNNTLTFSSPTFVFGTYSPFVMTFHVQVVISYPVIIKIIMSFFKDKIIMSY